MAYKKGTEKWSDNPQGVAADKSFKSKTENLFANS